MHCFDYAENSENTFLKNLAMDYKELKIRNKQLELENKKLKVLLDVDFFVNSHLPDIPSPSKVISAYVIQEKNACYMKPLPSMPINTQSNLCAIHWESAHLHTINTVNETKVLLPPTKTRRKKHYA